MATAKVAGKAKAKAKSKAKAKANEALKKDEVPTVAKLKRTYEQICSAKGRQKKGAVKPVSGTPEEESVDVAKEESGALAKEEDKDVPNLDSLFEEGGEKGEEGEEGEEEDSEEDPEEEAEEEQDDEEEGEEDRADTAAVPKTKAADNIHWAAVVPSGFPQDSFAILTNLQAATDLNGKCVVITSIADAQRAQVCVIPTERYVNVKYECLEPLSVNEAMKYWETDVFAMGKSWKVKGTQQRPSGNAV